MTKATELTQSAMALERMRTGSCLRIPDLDGAVIRCRYDQSRIEREGNRVDPAVMALERMRTGGRHYIPDLDSASPDAVATKDRIKREGNRA